MFKKIFGFLAVTVLTMVFTGITAFASSATIDKSNLSKGYITVTASSSKTVKVQIEKAPNKYVYTIKNSNPVNFPLQMGSGDYKVSVLENVSGNSYKPLVAESVTLSANVSEADIYKNSIQLIDFNSNMNSIKELNKLIAAAKNDEDKINIIHDYIINNITYDFDKVSKVTSDYIPVIDDVYKAKKGICYDYASLFASILRINNIPTKLQMGYFSEVQEYHAWNEVLLNNKWYKIDCTYDAQANSYKMEFKMLKDNKAFQVAKEY